MYSSTTQATLCPHTSRSARIITRIHKSSNPQLILARPNPLSMIRTLLLVASLLLGACRGENVHDYQEEHFLQNLGGSEVSPRCLVVSQTVREKVAFSRRGDPGREAKQYICRVEAVQRKALLWNGVRGNVWLPDGAWSWGCLLHSIFFSSGRQLRLLAVELL